MARIVCGAVACAIAQFASAQTDASTYPNRPVRIIVPYPPGGGADILVGRWGQPIVVENRAGAGGNVGTELVFNAAPDGYVLLFTAQPPLVVNKSLHGKLNFNPDAMAPIIVTTTAYSVLMVNPKVPVSSLPDFIAYAKANPGKLNYASQGIGNAAHLTAELFNILAGVNEAMKLPDVASRLREMSMFAVGGGPEEMAQFMKEERERWSAVIRASGAKVE